MIPRELIVVDRADRIENRGGSRPLQRREFEVLLPITRNGSKTSLIGGVVEARTIWGARRKARALFK